MSAKSSAIDFLLKTIGHCQFNETIEAGISIRHCRLFRMPEVCIHRQQFRDILSFCTDHLRFPNCMSHSLSFLSYSSSMLPLLFFGCCNHQIMHNCSRFSYISFVPCLMSLRGRWESWMTLISLQIKFSYQRKFVEPSSSGLNCRDSTHHPHVDMVEDKIAPVKILL